MFIGATEQKSSHHEIDQASLTVCPITRFENQPKKAQLT